MSLFQSCRHAITHEDIDDKGKNEGSHDGQTGPPLLSLHALLLCRHLRFLLTHSLLLDGILPALLGDGRIEVLYYLNAYGPHRIKAFGHHVHVEFLQHPLLNRLQRIVQTIFPDEFLGATEIIGCVIPKSYLTQIIAAEYQAFCCQRITRLQKVLVYLCRLGLAPHAFKGRSTIDVVACPLLVGIVGTCIRQLVVGVKQLAIAVYPVHRLLIVVDFQKVVADVDDTDKGITVGYRIRILLHIVKMGLIAVLQALVGSLLAQA